VTAVNVWDGDPRKRLVVSERDAQNRIVDTAKVWGWRVHAERPAFTREGYRTPIQGHVGFPDLVLVHPVGGLHFVELKIGSKLTVDQQTWGDAIVAAGGAWREVRIRHVDDLDAFCDWLRDAVTT
jgi:hypothetical protein